MEEDTPFLRLDLRGLKCPLPVLHARRALERALPRALIVVECTDPMAAIDIPHLVNQSGNALEMQERREDGQETVLVFQIRKSG